MAIELKKSSDRAKPKDSSEHRCICGNMVAKSTEETVEIKCRRCKRIHQIPAQVEKNRVAQEQDGAIEERCECGNLLAMISEETVEIKCRRCKRIHVISVQMAEDYVMNKIKRLYNK